MSKNAVPHVLILRILRFPVAMTLGLVAAAVTMVPTYRARIHAIEQSHSGQRVIPQNSSSLWRDATLPVIEVNPSDTVHGEVRPDARFMAQHTPSAEPADGGNEANSFPESSGEDLSEEKIQEFLRATQPDAPPVEESAPGSNYLNEASQTFATGHTWFDTQAPSIVSLAAHAAGRVAQWQQQATAAAPAASESPAETPVAAEAAEAATTAEVAVTTPEPPPAKPTPSSDPAAEPARIILTNPDATGYAISFVANRQVYTLAPGKSLELLANSVVIRFDRGRPGSEPARLELTPGTYAFQLRPEGWDLPISPAAP